MNRKLSYNGKELYQMTISELEEQLKTNQKRILVRSLFLLLVTLAAGFTMPILVIFPIAVLVITDYWILQNNKEIRREIERRYLKFNIQLYRVVYVAT